MATTREIRRRMRSIGNITQITRAMEMVSAAKMRRATERAQASRPYADRIRTLIAALSGLTDIESGQFPLLERRPVERMTVVLMTSDKGLAGALNSNVIRSSVELIRAESGRRAEVIAVGRKGRDFYRKRKAKISGEHVGLFNKALHEESAPIARRVIERYRNREVDAVYLLYNEFKSVMAQRVVVHRVVPVELPEETKRIDYIYEQPPLELLETLLPRYVEVSLHHAVLESAAAEHGARMTAMDAATSNASEMIDKLTLYMNRVRQASITREIIEVVSGASALA